MNEPRESSWKEFLRFTLIALAIVIPFRLYVAQPFVVSGSSMVPTFESGDYLIVDELSYRFNEPKRGDVIILKKPRQEEEYLIKRIVGLPGEKLTIENGIVSIKSPSGQVLVLKEPYLKNKSRDNSEIELGPEEYFAMGDNRPSSLDSRFIGPIPKDHIVGRAYLRLFPPSEIDIFPGFYNYQ